MEFMVTPYVGYFVCLTPYVGFFCLSVCFYYFHFEWQKLTAGAKDDGYSQMLLNSCLNAMVV